MMDRNLTREERIILKMNENKNKSSLEQTRGYCEAFVDGEMAIELATRKQDKPQMNEKEIKAYRDGFIAGHDMKANYKYQMFGYDIEKLLDIIGEYKLKEAEQPKPAFEINYPNGSRHSYKIWADGRIEGFADNAVVINRIPELMGTQWTKGEGDLLKERLRKFTPSPTEPTVIFEDHNIKLQTDPTEGLQLFVYGKLVYQYQK